VTLLEGLTPVAPTGLFPLAWLMIAIPLVSAGLLLLLGKVANSFGHYIGRLRRSPPSSCGRPLR